MGKKKRLVEVLAVKLRFIESNTRSIVFSELLNILNKKEFRSGDKIFELTLMPTSIENSIVGMIVTTQDKNMPPIRDKKTKSFKKVDINPNTQGLAFANIFIYDTSNNIFIFEINKNGCFIDKFIEFIYEKWKEDDSYFPIDISFPAILRKNEYVRMLHMDYFKKIKIELYNPSEIINCFNDANDSITNNIVKRNIEMSAEGNANSLIIEQIAINKKINP